MSLGKETLGSPEAKGQVESSTLRRGELPRKMDRAEHGEPPTGREGRRWPQKGKCGESLGFSGLAWRSWAGLEPRAWGPLSSLNHFPKYTEFLIRGNC